MVKYWTPQFSCMVTLVLFVYLVTTWLVELHQRTKMNLWRTWNWVLLMMVGNLLKYSVLLTPFPLQMWKKMGCFHLFWQCNCQTFWLYIQKLFCKRLKLFNSCLSLSLCIIYPPSLHVMLFYHLFWSQLFILIGKIQFTINLKELQQIKSLTTYRNNTINKV